MTSSWITAGMKQVLEDGVNGLEVRTVDSTGNTPVQAVRMALTSQAGVTTLGSDGADTVAAFTELLVTLNVTAISGTSPVLNVFIDVSDDGGTTWYTHVYQVGAPNIAAAGTQTPLTLSANAGKAFGDTIRVSWTLTGTTPSATFVVNAIGK